MFSPLLVKNTNNGVERKRIPFKTPRAAMRQAKRDANIPTSQTHKTHRQGKAQTPEHPETEMVFEVDGQEKTIQHAPKGHKFGDGEVDPTPHYNNHPDTKKHYDYGSD